MNTSLVNHPIAKGIGALAFIGAILAYAFWPRHMPPPSETNRVSHPAGYSVIRPANWTSRIEPTSQSPNHKDFMALDPGVETKWPPGLMITRLRHAPDPSKLRQEGFKETSFQNQPAQTNYYEIKHYWIWRTYIERDGDWFELRLQINNYEDVTSSDWWGYLNSFKYNRPATTQPSA